MTKGEGWQLQSSHRNKVGIFNFSQRATCIQQINAIERWHLTTLIKGAQMPTGDLMTINNSVRNDWPVWKVVVQLNFDCCADPLTHSTPIYLLCFLEAISNKILHHLTNCWWKALTKVKIKRNFEEVVAFTRSYLIAQWKRQNWSFDGLTGICRQMIHAESIIFGNKSKASTKQSALLLWMVLELSKG